MAQSVLNVEERNDQVHWIHHRKIRRRLLWSGSAPNLLDHTKDVHRVVLPGGSTLRPWQSSIRNDADGTLRCTDLHRLWQLVLLAQDTQNKPTSGHKSSAVS